MLGNWTGRAVQVLAPVVDRMTEHLKASGCLFVDETTVPVLAPGTGKTRRDYLWAVARDQRGYDGPDPPAVVFNHSRSRSAKTALNLLRGYAGRRGPPRRRLCGIRRARRPRANREPVEPRLLLDPLAPSLRGVPARHGLADLRGGHRPHRVSLPDRGHGARQAARTGVSKRAASSRPRSPKPCAGGSKGSSDACPPLRSWPSISGTP